jgi:hypothetical protein
MSRIGLALFSISLVLPAVAVTEQPLLWGGPVDRTWWGLNCLLYGWFMWPGWLANPLAFLAACCTWLKHYQLAWVFAWLAVVDAIAAPFVIASVEHLRYPNVGYFCWLASMIAFAIAATQRASGAVPAVPASPEGA